MDNGNKITDFGDVVISSKRQEIKGRVHHFFPCKSQKDLAEEELFGSFTELRQDTKKLVFSNIENGVWEGKAIKFEIDKSLHILEVSYNEWYDAINDNRDEIYEVIECGINLNHDPFKSNGHELIADYFVKVKHTTDFKWSWKENVDFFVITGRFKCDKNMW